MILLLYAARGAACIMIGTTVFWMHSSSIWRQAFAVLVGRICGASLVANHDQRCGGRDHPHLAGHRRIAAVAASRIGGTGIRARDCPPRCPRRDRPTDERVAAQRVHAGEKLDNRQLRAIATQVRSCLRGTLEVRRVAQAVADVRKDVALVARCWPFM